MHANFRTPLRTSTAVAAAAVLVVGGLMAGVAAAAAARPAPIMFEAVAVRDNAPSQPARITLDRWSTDAERNELMAAVAANPSPDAVAAAVAKMVPIGTFRTISGLTNEIRYAREFMASDGSRQLVLVTDQDIAYWDGEEGATAEQHPYTMIAVRFAPGAAAGEGKISHTRLVLGDRNTQLEFGHFDAAPVSLVGVRELVSSVKASEAAISYEAVAVRDDASQPARILLDRWSTDAERNELMATVATRTSPDAVAAAVARMAPIGTFRTIDGLTNEIRYARQFTEADGTRRLVLVTDDDVAYWDGNGNDEVTPRTHPYTVIEVRFAPGAATGEGKVSNDRLALADANTQLGLARFDSAPVRLMGVRQLVPGTTPTAEARM